ncbi:MAG: DsrE family protein [Thiotrichales bacterium]
MKREHGSRFSDEVLNAIVDNEYSADEKAELMAAVSQDGAASHELCELQRVKFMLQSAYGESAGAGQTTSRLEGKNARGWMGGAVASLLVFFMAVGASLYLIGPEQRMVLLDPHGQGHRAATQQDDAVRIVFHVNSNIKDRAGDLLNEIEGLLLEYQNEEKPLRVEVVANGEGLGLLRAGMSTQKARLTELSKHYPNLTFVACMNTVERLRVEQGVVVRLVPEAEKTDSGVAYVVKRQQEGWIYIQA